MPPETAVQAVAAATTVTVAARDFIYIAPEILLTFWGLVVLLADVALFARVGRADTPAISRSAGSPRGRHRRWQSACT